MGEEQQGLYRKYRVTRVDEEDRIGGRHDGCSLFVLDITHDMHARKALARYAQSVRMENPQLAQDLRALLVTAATTETYRG